MIDLCIDERKELLNSMKDIFISHNTLSTTLSSSVLDRIRKVVNDEYDMNNDDDWKCVFELYIVLHPYFNLRRVWIEHSNANFFNLYDKITS